MGMLWHTYDRDHSDPAGIRSRTPLGVPPSGGLRPRKGGTPNKPNPEYADHEVHAVELR